MSERRLTTVEMRRVADSLRTVDDEEVCGAGASGDETAEIRAILGAVANELDRRAAGPETVDASSAPLICPPDSAVGSALNAIPAQLPSPESPTKETGD